MNIKPKIGLDDITFGMTRKQIKLKIGRPEKISFDNYGGDDDDKTVAWYYWDKGISFHFDSDTDWRLSLIEINNNSALLNGINICGISYKKLSNILNLWKISYKYNKKEGLVDIKKWRLYFWIEDKVVISIQWGVFLNDDDEYQWPKEYNILTKKKEKKKKNETKKQ